AGQLDIFSTLLPDTQEEHTYPDIPEFSTRELLLLEKESSGMYFSGHLLDDYKDDIESVKFDGISDILAAFEPGESAPSYKEKDKVTVCGMITAKTVKNTRNGAKMAFLTLEDRTAEMEVIVFPKQFEGYADILLGDTAVRVRGTLSEREDEGVKLILSEAELLLSNAKFTASATAGAEPPKAAPQKGACLYLRVPSLSDPKTREALEMVRFSKGDVEVLFYDASSGKTVAPKDTKTNPTSMMLGALRALLGDANVVLRI
ncbi:MAG: hypothetical protein E7657_04690, partial [Ruminococcaceae bacterium]|nr:hypothetical protein [Oscillospiraceae bacterium]